MKIALVSEHASPLAVAGGVDTGGQNVYVAHVARQLHRAGHQVDVFTRRDRALLPLVSEMEGVRVIHVPAGPPMQLPKERLLPYMPAFADFLLGFCRKERRPYDVIHANFFMSGLAALKVKDALQVPLVMPRLGEPVEPSRVEGVTPWWRAVDADGTAPAPTSSPLKLPRELPWPMD